MARFLLLPPPLPPPVAFSQCTAADSRPALLPSRAGPQAGQGQPGAAAVSSNALLQALQSAMAAAAAPAAAPFAPLSAQPVAAAPPVAAPPAAAAPAPGVAVSGAALLQALQQIMGGGVPGMPPPAAQQQAQALQHAGAAPAAADVAGSPRADKYATTPRPISPAPSWTKAADSWTVPASPPDHAILPSAAAAAEGSPVQQACSKVLGQTVTLGTAPGGGAAVHLLLAPAAQPAGALKLTASAVDTAIGRIPSGNSLVLALQGAWLRAAEALAAATAAPEEAAAVLHLWQVRLAHKAAEALATDEDDDLFFAGGRQRGAFQQALVRGVGGCWERWFDGCLMRSPCCRPQTAL